MRRWLPALALLCLVGTAVFFWLGRPPAPPQPSSAPQPDHSNTPSLQSAATPSSPDSTAPPPQPSATPSIPPSTNSTVVGSAPPHFDAALLASPNSPAPKLP